jgi:hypothetical protein
MIRQSNPFLFVLSTAWLAGACSLDDNTIVALDGDEDAVLRDSLDRPLGPVARAIVAESRDNDVELNLLARIEVKPDELLEIYEPRPGMFIVSGAGAPVDGTRGTSEPLQGQSIRELCLALADGAEMPAALEEAVLRSEEAVPAPAISADERPALARSGTLGHAESPPVDMSAPGTSRAAGFCNSGFFATDANGDSLANCFLDAWETDFTVCLDNWANGAYAQTDDGKWTESVVCPTLGSVLMELQTDGDSSGTWTVPQHTFRSVTVYESNCEDFWSDCPWVRVDIKQASGDKFHFRFLSDIE